MTSYQLENVRPVERPQMRSGLAHNVAPNLTTVTHPHRNQLAAQLQQQERAGRIKRIGRIQVDPMTRTATARFIRLKPEPKRWPWAVAGTLLIAGGLTTIGWMIYDAARVLAYGFGTVLAVGAVIWLLTRVSHSGGCVGIHCSGCKG